MRLPVKEALLLPKEHDGQAVILRHDDPRVGYQIAVCYGELLLVFSAACLIIWRTYGGEIDMEDASTVALFSAIDKLPSLYEVEVVRTLPSLKLAALYIQRKLQSTGYPELDAQMRQDGLLPELAVQS